MVDTVLAHAISGGVDSSVAASLLQAEWNRPEENRIMIGVYHDICPDATCFPPSVRQRAGRVCSDLNMPFFIVDMVDEFRKQVIDDFVNTYIAGRTPNPCIRCNEAIRFSSFYDRVKHRCIEQGLLSKGGTLYFSTGHYAHIENTMDGPLLKRAIDRRKDQSYMLYRLKKEYLPFFLFPLGGYYKRDVIAMAERLSFPTTSVKESQDICFIHGDYFDFIREYAAEERLQEPGMIIDTGGNRLGEHKGYIYYTVGQRKGLNLGDGPWYVVGIRPKENIIVVGRNEEQKKHTFRVESLHWFIPASSLPLRCDIKVRYNTPPFTGTVFSDDEGTAMIRLDEPAVITPGQSAVFYRNDLVLGGGIISS